MRESLLLLLAKLTGKDFRRELRIIDSIHGGETDLKDFIEKSLSDLLVHAHGKVRYYKPLLEKAGVVKGGKIDLQNFSKIDLLRRRNLQDNFRDLLPYDIAKRKYYSDTAGGSTGRPVRFVRDLSSYRWAKATEFFYYDRFIGVNEMQAKKVLVWGSARELLHGVGIRERIIHYLTNSLYLNAYLLDEREVLKFIQKMNGYRPDILKGFPSFLHIIGSYLLSKGLEVHSPKAIISTGETLTAYRRKVIEDAFGSKVYNFYGAREAPSIAGECKNGSMHIFSFNNLVEVLDEEGNAATEGSLGRVVLTPLHNYAMPLIRYEIGDVAKAKYGRCNCSPILPVMGEVVGRNTEFVLRRDGSLLSGEFFEGVFRVEDWVREFQVIQEDYDLLRILVVPKERNNIDLSIPQEKILRAMKGDCKIKWEIVDEIPRPPSGKHFYVKSLIS